MDDSALPVTVLGGYLGAGKTTLLNHLVRNAGGRRLAILVNDFGDIGIDSALVESQDGDVVNLAGGCVCCSFGSDLAGCLVTLGERRPRPTHVLIETSGVALPGSVGAAVALCAGMRLDAIVTLVAADQVRATAVDKYVGDTVLTQVRQADLVVVSKVDLVNGAEAGGVLDWIRAQAPAARVIRSVMGQLAPEAILDPPAPPDRRVAAGPSLFRQFGEEDAPGRPIGRWAGAAPDAFASLSVTLAAPVDIDAIVRVLRDPRWAMVRAKGILLDREGSPMLLQMVGDRLECSPSGAGGGSGLGLVCIGIAGRFEGERLRTALERAAALP